MTAQNIKLADVIAALQTCTVTGRRFKSGQWRYRAEGVSDRRPITLPVLIDREDGTITVVTTWEEWD